MSKAGALFETEDVSKTGEIIGVDATVARGVEIARGGNATARGGDVTGARGGNDTEARRGDVTGVSGNAT
jgi:hypothetical protein